jgi:hypothetical protein
MRVPVVWFVVGLILGLLVPILIGQPWRYSIASNNDRIIKIDRTTGETWRFTDSGWRRLPTE